MLNLSDNDKEYLKILIIDCETFHLSEKESLDYIGSKLKRVSRETYYRFKKAITDDNTYGNIFSGSSFFGGSPFTKSLSSLYLGTQRMKIVNSSSDIRIRSHNVWDDIDFVSRYSDRYFADANDVIARSHRLSGRINSQIALANKNYKSIPSGATIREEYVKCGNPYCYRCKHGPYYYGYWKENGKLKKKYIGKYDPRNEANSENHELNF
jgi:hypothetical protein